jgi:hypothetical protein
VVEEHLMTKNRTFRYVIAMALGGLPVPALADAPAPPPMPAVVQQVYDCRTIAIDADRLACYDRQVAVLAQAQQDRQVVVADQQEVREARRGLFGFSLPNIKLFGDGTDAESQQIETTVVSARQYNYGQWQLVLEGGAVWNQIDTETLAIDPHPGSTIVIRRAALGSFRARIGGQPSIRVRRVQ